MSAIPLTLESKHAETDTIWSFVFQSAAPLAWKAGQSLRIEVPGAYGPLEHRFSISSAPFTKKITITTRRSDSDFKQSLFSLQPGDNVQGFGLEGDFIWHDALKNPVFIAAGVGITPFHAMLAERIHAGLPLDASLVYGGSNNNLAFRSTLDGWAYNNPLFQIHYKTDQRITPAYLFEIVPDIAKRPIFIAGP